MGYHANRDDLRIGDEVLYYDTSGYGVHVVGIVEKVNKKSVKIRQTNDDYRHTKAAFGNYGGRKVGGEGFVWAVPCTDAGATSIRFSKAQKERMKDTPRAAMIRRRDVQQRLDQLQYYIEAARKNGATYEEVLEIVEAEFAASEAAAGH